MTTSFLPKGQGWPFPSAGPLAGPARLLNEVIDHKAATQTPIDHHFSLVGRLFRKGVVLENGMSSAGDEELDRLANDKEPGVLTRHQQRASVWLNSISQVTLASVFFSTTSSLRRQMF